MADEHFVSIIIPALNEEQVIGQCLEAITNLSTSVAKFEVILVDNGSTDRTCEIAQEFGIRIISKPKINISALRNWGAKQAKGDVLAFIDADNIVPENWLDNSLIYFVRANVAAVGSRYRHLNSSWVSNAWAMLHEVDMKLGEVDWLPAGNILVVKEVFEEIGGFDESLVTSEDYDFCLRLGKRGFKIFSDPKLASLHLGPPKTLLQFYKKELWHGREMVHVFAKSEIRLREFGSLVFALFFGFCLAGLVLTFAIGLVFNFFPPMFFFFFLFLLSPVLLAIKSAVRLKAYRNVPSLTLLYLVYGFARLVCLLRTENYHWIK